MRKLFFLFTLFMSLLGFAQEGHKLTGEVIGTRLSVNYNDGSASTSVNSVKDAFDGKLNTFFAAYDRNLGWCGLDLGRQHVITRVRWSPRDDSHGEKRVVLAVFEGANREDFMDAVPLFVNDRKGSIGQYDQADIHVTSGFRYVRYIGPNDSRCNIAEVEFYGYEGSGDNSCYYRPTNLPLVNVHIEENKEPWDKEHDLKCVISLFNADENSSVVTHDGTIRLRGNASMNFPKKPYRLKFSDDQYVFNSPAKAKKWTLINNYGDKTLMRNILAFEASRRMGMAYTPYCQPVDVMVNGEYKGCYQLCDQIERGSDRIDIEKMKAEYTSGPNLTGGYLIEVDAYADQETSWFTSNRGNPVTIKYPEDDKIVSEQSTYIRNQFCQMESNLFSTSFMNEDGYRSRLDIDSFLRYFLACEFTGNTDSFWSTYMYKHRDNPLFYTGPLWDHDLAFENDNRTNPICRKSDYIYLYGSSAGNMKQFVTRIIKGDTRTSGDLLEIWKDAREKHDMTPDSFISFVDFMATELDASQRLNYLRWPNLNEWVHQNWQVAGSYQGEVEIVKNYIRDRFAWLDEKLGYDPSTSGVINVRKDDADNGIYTLHGIYMGTDFEALSPGVYVVNGKKMVKR